MDHDQKGSRKRNALDMGEIRTTLHRYCCDRRCVASALNEDLILRWRLKYHSTPQGLKRQLKLMELYRDTVSERKHHIINGTEICRKAWYQCLMGISEKTYKRLVTMVNKGLHVLDKTDKKRKDKKGLIAQGFMTNFVRIYGEIHPSSGNTLLPVGVTIKSIYEKYKKRYRCSEETLQFAQFHKIWKTNFYYVKKQKISKMAKCDVCTLAKDVLSEIRQGHEKEAIQTDWDEHLERQRLARESYYARRDEGIGNDDVTSLIIDGMDQRKTDLPHFTQMPKCLDVANMLNTHLTGVLIHGQPTQIFLDYNQFPHDSNLTINCMLRALWNHGNKLTVKEIIHVNFLMVGHTHEDIDQRFSLISRLLKKTSTKTVPELKECIETSGMTVTDQDFIYDFKSWLCPFLEEGLHNHSSSYSFRLFKDETGLVVLQYKKWPMDLEWHPQHEKIHLFKTRNGKQLIPSGVPPPVQPNWENTHLDKVKETVKKSRWVSQYHPQRMVE